MTAFVVVDVKVRKKCPVIYEFLNKWDHQRASTFNVQLLRESSTALGNSRLCVIPYEVHMRSHKCAQGGRNIGCDRLEQSTTF